LSRYRYEAGTDTRGLALYRRQQRQRKEKLVRKALLILGVLAALAVPAAATAKQPQPVICGGVCDAGGTGYTGCTNQTASQSFGVPYLSYVRHYLVVSYCKVNGWITSVSIAAHGCDYQGTAFCSTGAAWQTGGGVGYGFATFTGHATYVGALAGVPFAGTSVVDLTVPLG
jgi:hypothetical protein